MFRSCKIKRMHVHKKRNYAIKSSTSWPSHRPACSLHSIYYICTPTPDFIATQTFIIMDFIKLN